MAQPYDYRIQQPNVGNYFDAFRAGRAERLATEGEARNKSLAQYLPGALKGDAAMRDQALASASPDQQISLSGVFAQKDAAELAKIKQTQAEGAAMAAWADTPEKWALWNAEGKKRNPNHQDVPFERRGLILSQAQTVAEQLNQAIKEKELALDESRTRAQNAASYASADASRAAADKSRRAADAPPLTATDKNAILDADQLVVANKSAVSLLQRAKDLSSNAYAGPAANTRGEITAFFGAPGGEATLEFDNLLQQQVLPQLKAIFGGQPTEGERKILLDLQGSSRLPHPVRSRIIDTALELAGARLQFNQDKARDLRGGDYFRNVPQYPDYTGAPAGPKSTPIIKTQAEFDALPSGAIYVEPDGKRYRKP